MYMLNFWTLIGFVERLIFSPTTLLLCKISSIRQFKSLLDILKLIAECEHPGKTVSTIPTMTP